MVSTTQRPEGPAPRAVAFTAIGWLGLAACLTLVFLGMRSVMDVGGSCADGGPYVSAQGCPDGATPSLMIGIFAGFGFGALGSIGGAAVGGIWAATPLLAWSGLFGSLGYNFMDYGVFSAPPDAGIQWGWAICGILFWAMALGPLLLVLPIARLARPRTGGDTVVRIGGPGQPGGPPAGPLHATTTAPVTVTRDGGTVTSSSTVIDGDELDPALRERLAGLGVQLADASGPGATGAQRAALGGIAADFGAAVTAAAAAAPVDPLAIRADARPAAPGAEFTEGTQALLDRLERLADMRDRGLLEPAEYETAKAAIMAELEERT